MSGAGKKAYITVKGARENNLKNIDIDIQQNSFTCITGPSGCGKSSLVYDTIFAESQRNFLESMSGAMFGQKLMEKPDVDEITNLHPALDVSQNFYNSNPRSTIGTITDISHYLRALYALICSHSFGTNFLERYFSANNPSSCCEKCHGLGEEYAISLKKLVPDERKTLKSGAVLLYKGKEGSYENKLLCAICNHYGIDIESKYMDLTEEEKNTLLYRNDNMLFDIKFKTPKGRYKQQSVRCNGAFVELNEKLTDIDTPSTFANIAKYLEKQRCSMCNGSRLKNTVLQHTICTKNIAEVESMCLSDFNSWLIEVENSNINSKINDQVSQLCAQMRVRVTRLISLLLGHLSINRSIPTLSSGEIQRVRIASQLNCPLNGLIYILDEPCKGLHPRNIKSIIDASKELVDKGNTLIAIEHNTMYINKADQVVEMGPEGGPNGGYILSTKSPTQSNKPFKIKEAKTSTKTLAFKGIRFHNVQNQSVNIPIGRVTCVSGVSGSGKSSLVSVIGECVNKRDAIFCDSVSGSDTLKKAIHVNQKPIGKTPRSTVVSYLEIYDPIRELYANEDSAKRNDLTSSDFSMNITGGRCETCQGTGLQKMVLNYLPDTYIVCPECSGKRFKTEVLAVRYHGISITELLDSSVDTIMHLFSDAPDVHSILQCLVDIGLGYIKLGQASMSLSGGEAQRIKLAKALGQNSSGNNLYILDEPTSGLATSDQEKLANIILNLEQNGNTIIVIEHNRDFISVVADYLIDFGTNSGNKGGIIVAEGTPQEVFKNTSSSWYGL